MSVQSEQLMLPLGVYPQREVMVQVAEEVRDWRKFGRRVVMVMAGQPQFEFVNVDAINDFQDPDLRYALRFAAAAVAAGSIQDSETSSHSLDVYIMATGEGIASRLLGEPWFSGTTLDGRDTFMEDIHSFAPTRDEDY